MRGAVSHQGHACGQRQTFVAGLKLAADARALGKPCGHPLQGRHQTLFQDGGAQVVHHALAGFDGVRHGFQGRHRALLHVQGRGVAAYPVQLKFQRGERAAHVVMDLARNGRTFHLDAGLQVLRQL